MKKKIFIIGGAGYVGSVLVEELLKNNYEVTVYDLLIYGADVLKKNDKLKIIKGDIRNLDLLKKEISGHDTIIHLACISNDPSFELNPDLGKSINFDCFEPLIKISIDQGIKQFIFASSSSVYGVKSEENVIEETFLEPLTDYSKFKAKCEEVLFKYNNNNFICTILRPATVCGYSPRQRLDLVVNILTNIAFHKKEIVVFGGDQLRPNIHINDMCRAYLKILESPINIIQGKIYNVGFENKKVIDIASMVKNKIDNKINIIVKKSEDNRSYHISSKKIAEELSYRTIHSIEDSIVDLIEAFRKKLFKDPLNNEFFYNIKRMKSINLK
jgi:nucleoside-diphosphate-sugar epimerase